MDPSAAAKGRRPAGLKHLECTGNSLPRHRLDGRIQPASPRDLQVACLWPLRAGRSGQAPMPRPHVYHGGVSMPASGLFSVTLSAISLSQSPAGR
jgi:hypothetical protein